MGRSAALLTYHTRRRIRDYEIVFAVQPVISLCRFQGMLRHPASISCI
ncbi:hypothetical protein WG66_007601, partial [Moniliophthora roreri]